jgi:hypothetical protein
VTRQRKTKAGNFTVQVDGEAREIVDSIPSGLRKLVVSSLLKRWAREGRDFGILNAPPHPEPAEAQGGFKFKI